LVAERLAHVLGYRPRGLSPVGETLGRVERSGLVERAGRAGINAEPALAAVELERRRGLELEVGDERAEHDPRAEAPRDEQRALAVEADSGARGRFAVDVLVCVDEHAVVPVEAFAE